MKFLKFSIGTIFILFVTFVISVVVALFTMGDPIIQGRPILWTIWYMAALLIVCMGLYDFSPLSNRKVKRVLGWGVLSGVLVFASVKGYYMYQDHLKIEERGVELIDYQPFTNSDRLAKLNHPTSVSFVNGVPRLDGATALYPMYASFVEAVYPNSGTYDPYNDQVSKVVSTTTPEAYSRLMNDQTDLIFVAGPSDRQLQVAKQKDVSLHMTPVGREAFVFFVHEDNPVESLTMEQVRGIYAGDIRNWKEVGGNSETIRAFQRPEDSGSQTALQKMMGERKLMEAPVEDVPQGMGGIIQQASSYRNHKNAIGFSFRYYATEMVNDHKVKLLRIDGVESTVKTIQDGSYPLTSEFYAVTTEEKAEQYDAFLKWLGSEDGQVLVEKTGYVRLK
ncbi:MULTISPECIES: substrate-binding domain-containing protein [unclassified Exiguobacterium]|uniref:PstS family phosphate ABC transporter substrate-binding protein n=1 Tax=unclassified Exiguobacterium TaxID=2644629 RepID=UPI001BECB590|nr:MULTISPECIES: substrate-binding domain-containing protein [unclassified Exiguobacterium]